ncbi:MAG: endolytic transglycosylase MltG [Alphaproteobacteria bacterium]|nr:endolytic transglycosylase MltG [Alphaproteobacteria bacterium]
MKRALGAILVVITAAVLIAGGVVLWGNETFQRAGPLERDTVIVIPRGAGLRTIATMLHRADVIRHPMLFIAKAKWTDAHRSLKAGEYAFSAHVSSAEALNQIRNGRVVIRRITIPEGFTSLQVAALIDAAPGLEGALDAVPAEGTVLPETYDYIYGDTRTALVRRMVEARSTTLDTLWKSRADKLPFTTPHAAATLASIVEKETASPDERPRIAAVFINRLRRGMRLQSDPTVVYALTAGKGPLGRRLTRADLAIDNPYNTYVIKGLPPGPITNPGAASLAAVLQPAETKELYFVADGNGGHAFAKTLREHNRNVARWRRLQRSLRKRQK